jgi:ribosomal protein S6
MIMTKKQYNALLAQHGAEELANSFVFPVKLTDRQKQKANENLQAALERKRAEMTTEEKLKFKLLQLRYQIEDYLNNKQFDNRKTFGFFLEMYVHSLNKRNKEFAHEINIKPAVLSQYMNDHRKPPREIIIRLELHSRKNIPASDWYRLLEKENIHELQTNTTLRTKQQKHIRRKATLA